jgi:hypothetical protein
MTTETQYAELYAHSQKEAWQRVTVRMVARFLKRTRGATAGDEFYLAIEDDGPQVKLTVTFKDDQFTLSRDKPQDRKESDLSGWLFPRAIGGYDSLNEYQWEIGKAVVARVVDVFKGGECTRWREALALRGSNYLLSKA